jgi:pre-mRNA-processing factor 8
MDLWIYGAAFPGNGHITTESTRKIGTSMPRTGITHYRSGLSHEEDQLIPNLYRYVA